MPPKKNSKNQLSSKPNASLKRSASEGHVLPNDKKHSNTLSISKDINQCRLNDVKDRLIFTVKEISIDGDFVVVSCLTGDGKATTVRVPQTLIANLATGLKAKYSYEFTKARIITTAAPNQPVKWAFLLGQDSGVRFVAAPKPTTNQKTLPRPRQQPNANVNRQEIKMTHLTRIPSPPPSYKSHEFEDPLVLLQPELQLSSLADLRNLINKDTSNTVRLMVDFVSPPVDKKPLIVTAHTAEREFVQIRADNEASQSAIGLPNVGEVYDFRNFKVRGNQATKNSNTGAINPTLLASNLSSIKELSRSIVSFNELPHLIGQVVWIRGNILTKPEKKPTYQYLNLFDVQGNRLRVKVTSKSAAIKYLPFTMPHDFMGRVEKCDDDDIIFVVKSADDIQD